MGDKVITGTISIVLAIIGVAIIAVIVSKQSGTADVLQAAGKSLSGIIGAAVAPVAGASNAPHISVI